MADNGALVKYAMESVGAYEALKKLYPDPEVRLEKEAELLAEEVGVSKDEARNLIKDLFWYEP